MNRFFLTAILFTIFIIPVAAQNTDDADFNIWYVQKDSSYAVFANKAYVRSGPGISNAIIDSVRIGEKVIAIEQTKTFTTVRNIHAPWLKVTYSKAGKPTEAYIWEGMLAIKCMNFGDVKFIYGIDRIEKILAKSAEGFSTTNFVIQLKAIKSDSLLAVKEWKIDGGESANFTDMIALGDTRLKNLTNVFRISFGGEACGIPTNYFYYGWTGTNLLPLPGKYSVGDADIFYHSETLLFPHEKGGQANKIIKLIEEEETLEEETDTKKAKIKHSSAKEVYVWNGEKAIRQK